MRYYCSYFDRNYLARVLVLIESLQKHEIEDFVFFAICLDEFSLLLMKKINNPNVRIIRRYEIERHDADLIEPRLSRSAIEYFWTLGPTAIRYVLARIPEGAPLYYIDADICFFSNPSELLSELDGYSVLIHEHHYSLGFKHLQNLSGRFNVGLIGVRNDAVGREVLDWWRIRCNEWCFAKYDEGRFGDQKYLDDWPIRFDGVHVLRHTGGGIAPWNQEQLIFRLDTKSVHNSRILIDRTPLVFFHFHALAPLNPHAYLLVKHAAYRIPKICAQFIYCFYVQRLEAWNAHLRSFVPEMTSGYWPTQALFPGAAMIIRDVNIGSLKNIDTINIGDGWTLLPGTQVF